MFHRCRDRRQDSGVKTKTEVDATHSPLRERAYSAFAAERHMRHPISNRAASVAETEVREVGVDKSPPSTEPDDP